MRAEKDGALWWQLGDSGYAGRWSFRLRGVTGFDRGVDDKGRQGRGSCGFGGWTIGGSVVEDCGGFSRGGVGR